MELIQALDKEQAVEKLAENDMPNCAVVLDFVSEEVWERCIEEVGPDTLQAFAEAILGYRKFLLEYEEE